MNSELPEDEREMLRILRSAKATANAMLPQVSPEEYKRRLRVVLALGSARVYKTMNYLRRISNLWPDPSDPPRYPGPRVVLTGTFQELKASWRTHVEHAIERGTSGPVIRHHREAIAYYCEALELDWRPALQRFEKRALTARARANRIPQLPEEFVALATSVVNDITYHADVAFNEMFRHRARLAFRSAPRIPSEDGAALRRNVKLSKNTIVYEQTKIAGVEALPIKVPRDVYDLDPETLTWESRRSYLSWDSKWRPKLIARAHSRGLLDEGEDHDLIWPDIDGLPSDPERYRQHFGAAAKEAWPGFYPYLCREVGIIMRYLEMVQKQGHGDIYQLAQWSGHSNLNNLVGYVRAGDILLRQAKPGPELNEILYQWRQM